MVSKIHELETAGVEQKNICIVARTHKLLDSYIAGLQRAGIKSFEIKANKTDDRTFEGVRIATMHRVKGLEFDYVFAVAVNKKVLPFGTRMIFLWKNLEQVRNACFMLHLQEQERAPV